MKISEVVKAYNEYINLRDMHRLTKLLDDKYVFIDTVGKRVESKQAGIDIWKGFFEQYPDYKNEFDTISEINDSTAIVTGRSICSFEPLNGPALWRAKVRAGKVLEWQVYDDTEANRKSLGIRYD